MANQSIETHSQQFSGIFTALATPFLKGEIDWFSLRNLIRQQVDGGIRGFVICGTTAESPTLTFAEKEKLFEFVRSEVSGAVTLVMGTGSNSTSETVHATKMAKIWGAAAALVVVPYYNKPSQRGLFEHFAMVAREGGLPVILYNVPSRTITKLELSTIQELSQISEIVAIKEASGNLELGQQIAETTPLLLSSGDDDSCMKLAGVGARGVISVVSHLIPSQMTKLFDRAVKGEIEASQSEWAAKFGALNRDLYLEANPIPLKYALSRLGIITSSEMRLPLTALDAKYRAAVDSALKAGGLL